MFGYLLSALSISETQPQLALSRRPVAAWLVGSSLALLGFFAWLMPGPSGTILSIGASRRSDFSDSLRHACRQIQDDLPKNLARLRSLGRPPISFYLGTAGVALAPQPDLDALLINTSTPSNWALVDDAMLRQVPDHAKTMARLLESWEIVREYPTTLNLPTLLDIDPGAASRPIKPADFECPLWLLRPRSQGARR
jgi:hypothetical protein